MALVRKRYQTDRTFECPIRSTEIACHGALPSLTQPYRTRAVSDACRDRNHRCTVFALTIS